MVARYRLSGPAQRDLANILATSESRWGSEGRRLYAALLIAAMRKAAADPEVPATRPRPELRAKIRCLHLRHALAGQTTKVRRPVHVIYYRTAQTNLIEIVRVLHERMDPGRHMEQTP